MSRLLLLAAASSPWRRSRSPSGAMMSSASRSPARSLMAADECWWAIERARVRSVASCACGGEGRWIRHKLRTGRAGLRAPCAAPRPAALLHTAKQSMKTHTVVWHVVCRRGQGRAVKGAWLVSRATPSGNGGSVHRALCKSGPPMPCISRAPPNLQLHVSPHTLACHHAPADDHALVDDRRPVDVHRTVAALLGAVNAQRAAAGHHVVACGQTRARARRRQSADAPVAQEAGRLWCELLSTPPALLSPASYQPHAPVGFRWMQRPAACWASRAGWSAAGTRSISQRHPERPMHTPPSSAAQRTRRRKISRHLDKAPHVWRALQAGAVLLQRLARLHRQLRAEHGGR